MAAIIDAVFWILFVETSVVNLFVWWNELKVDYMLHVSKLFLKLLSRFAVRSAGH